VIGRPPSPGVFSGPASTRLLSWLALLLLWEGAALLAGSRLFPPVSTVVAAMVQDIRSGVLPYNLALTLARVAAAFAISMLLGTALGLAMGTWRRLDRCSTVG
jgi:NitT/TauT family transport system permease protein